MNIEVSFISEMHTWGLEDLAGRVKGRWKVLDCKRFSTRGSYPT